jgi:uncharacterized caspase-like protein
MRKALVIGIDRYPFGPLRSCVNDASTFNNLVEINGDGSRNFDTKLALNVSQKTNMVGQIRELFIGKHETVMLYFSGHGYINDLGGYLVTPDAKQYDEGVSMDDILILANNSPSENKIIILDCCHAGAMGTPLVTGASMAQVREGVTILAASLNNQAAIEIASHGVFTGFLLDALRGGAADLRGHITPGSVYAYIDKALGPWSQRPVFKSNITKFTTLRTISPHIEIDTLRKIVEYFPSQDYHIGLDPEYEDTYPNSKENKTVVFKHLQKFFSLGLVTPVGEEYMYWAAVNSKSCKLTHLGSYYWRLVKDRRI